MGWAHGTQFEAAVTGAKIEHGCIDLPTTLETIEVPTRLKVIESAIVTYKEVPDAATRLVCDCAITNGAVTIGDVEGVQSTSRFVNYLFIGH